MCTASGCTVSPILAAVATRCWLAEPVTSLPAANLLVLSPTAHFVKSQGKQNSPEQFLIFYRIYFQEFSGCSNLEENTSSTTLYFNVNIFWRGRRRTLEPAEIFMGKERRRTGYTTSRCTEQADNHSEISWLESQGQ